MLQITIPGYRRLDLNHLVLDYNGTLACDGLLLPGVESRLKALTGQLELHVLTADTFGSVAQTLVNVPCRLTILPQENQTAAKQAAVIALDSEQCVCVGNGRNDRLMLQTAGLGIAVMQAEGAAVETVLAADVVVPDIIAGLDLLLHPLRLVATLRV